MVHMDVRSYHGPGFIIVAWPGYHGAAIQTRFPAIHEFANLVLLCCFPAIAAETPFTVGKPKSRNEVFLRTIFATAFASLNRLWHKWDNDRNHPVGASDAAK